VEMIASPSLEEVPRSNNRNLKRRSSPTAELGDFTVQDSGVAIRSVKVDESEVDGPAAGQSAPTSVTANPARNLLKPAVSFKPKSLNVLVAEDDPVSPVFATPPRTHARNHNRVPIFAVSASLPESRADEITRAQFDGWILKPIN